MKSEPVALVTGATSGIGEATAHRLHDRGYTVFAAGRNPEALNTLRSSGLQARSLDVTDEAAVDRLVDEINAEHGGVDVLVNSAGYPLPRPLEQVELSELRHLFETNVVATLHLSQAVLPTMRAQGYGRIVTIGSTGGRFTSPGAGAYHTVKYAIEALSLSMSAEVAPFGVRVVVIDPTGAPFCLWQPKQTQGIGVMGENNSYVWADLITGDRLGAKQFYQQLLLKP